MQSSRIPPGIALVTGAAGGIGRAAARGLLADGWTVVLTGRRAEPLQALADEATGQGHKAVAIPADVTDPASVQALFDAIEQRFGLLVSPETRSQAGQYRQAFSNAGLTSRPKRFCSGNRWRKKAAWRAGG